MIGSVSSLSAVYAAKVSRMVSKNEGQLDDKRVFPLAEIQAESAKENQAKADNEIRNSVAIRSLASKGLVLTMHTPTSDYKDAALMTVDSNKDNIVSDSELATQIQIGGGDLEQVASLYKAMDIDGDGEVSGQEFKDSIPDPFSSSAFRQRLNDLNQSSSTGNAHPAAIGNLFRDQADMVKIAAVLAELARKTQV